MKTCLCTLMGISLLMTIGNLSATNSPLMSGLLDETEGSSRAHSSQPGASNTGNQSDFLREEDKEILPKVQNIVANFRNSGDFLHALGDDFRPLARNIISYQANTGSEAERRFELAKLFLEAYVLVKRKPLAFTDDRKSFRFYRLLTMEYLKRYPLSSETHQAISDGDLDKFWKYCSKLRNEIIEPSGNIMVQLSTNAFTKEKFKGTDMDKFLRQTNFPPEELLRKILYKKFARIS